MRKRISSDLAIIRLCQGFQTSKYWNSWIKSNARTRLSYQKSWKALRMAITLLLRWRLALARPILISRLCLNWTSIMDGASSLLWFPAWQSGKVFISLLKWHRNILQRNMGRRYVFSSTIPRNWQKLTVLHRITLSMWWLSMLRHLTPRARKHAEYTWS